MRNVFVLKLVLFFSFVLVLSSGAFALNDCFLADHDVFQPGYQLTGFVSMQGHYANNLSAGRVAYPHGVFCDDRLVIGRPDEVSTFNFSDPNQFLFTHNGVNVYGSGHVTFTGTGVLFNGQAYHGFTEGACRIVPDGGSCDTQEVCVLRVSNQNQGTVADCNNITMPYPHDFRNRICCTPTEYCRDGIDNTGDNLVDCASPDCHPSDHNEDTPQRCDPGDYDPGNNQTTLDCVLGGTPEDPVFSEHCTYPTAVKDLYFYCSYGELDDPSEVEEGYCCPEGQYYDPDTEMCEDFTKCGVGSGTWCHYNFNQYFSNWIDQLYSGEFNWCYSHLPLFTSYGLGSTTKSEACCPIIHMGTFDYYVIDENVKIFGYE